MGSRRSPHGLFWFPINNPILLSRRRKRPAVDPALIASLNEPAQIANDPFRGPSSDRSCTDVVWLAIFAAILGGWAFLAQHAIRHGNITRIWTNPVDSFGRRCGLDYDVKTRPYLMYFDLRICIDPWVLISGCDSVKACVARCPQRDFYFRSDLCQKNEGFYRERMVCDEEIQNSDLSCYNMSRYITHQRCAKYYMKSELIWYHCIPWSNTATDITYSFEMKDILAGMAILREYAKVIGNIYDDIKKTWHIVGIILLAVAGCCIGLIATMRWTTTPLVWLSSICALSISCYGMYYCLKEFQRLENPTTFMAKLLISPKVWLYGSMVCALFFVIVSFALFGTRKRINRAIELIKECGMPMTTNFLTSVVPILPWAMHITIIVATIYVFLNLITVEEATYRVSDYYPDGTCRCHGPADEYRCKTASIQCSPYLWEAYCFNWGSNGTPCIFARCRFQKLVKLPGLPYYAAYLIFGAFWTSCFVSALAEMALANTFATWYWTNCKKHVPFFITIVGLARTIRYSLGTVAFGSLIINICEVCAAFVTFIDRVTRSWDSLVTSCITYCMCGFTCPLYNFLQYMNKNAYILCAIHGRSLMNGAHEAFDLLIRNVERIIFLDGVTMFLFFLIKVLASIGAAIVAFIYFHQINGQLKLKYVSVPVVFVAIGTYMVTTALFDTYSMAINTIFLCFLEDCERNDGSKARPYFMSQRLMRIFEKKKEKPQSKISFTEEFYQQF